MNRIAQSLFALAAALIFVSCSNNSTNALAANTSSTTVASSAAVASSGSQKIVYGSIKDSRDGQTYKTVVIGTQTWLAKNLNYTPTVASDSSWCYINTDSLCNTYGRLYNYAAAAVACPAGWHLPDTSEFGILGRFVGSSNAAVELKSVTGWAPDPVDSAKFAGVDAYGFSALAGGQYYSMGSGSFGNIRKTATFWTTTATDDTHQLSLNLDYYMTSYLYSTDYVNNGSSVRCIKN